ncbi:hypothetical protein [Cupriavidus lacunae]|uniref:hypothetical protein n=1 Tax=Cupriavidus lacunae TaxID=2666307 RepID=UPI0010589124|nr:hypothetical protein [Cupriavidus lacunae]
MPFKYDEAGNIAVQEVGGKKLPVFVGADGSEVRHRRRTECDGPCRSQGIRTSIHCLPTRAESC